MGQRWRLQLFKENFAEKSTCRHRDLIPRPSVPHKHLAPAHSPSILTLHPETARLSQSLIAITLRDLPVVALELNPNFPRACPFRESVCPQLGLKAPVWIPPQFLFRDFSWWLASVHNKGRRFFPERAFGWFCRGEQGEARIPLKTGFFSPRLPGGGGNFGFCLANYPQRGITMTFPCHGREFVHFGENLYSLAGYVGVGQGEVRTGGKNSINSLLGSCLATNMASPTSLSPYIQY